MRVHYVYQIENLIDGKIYIGKHSTDRLEDGYMGSGKLLSSAICKYGVENFRKTIISFFETEEMALEYEKLLVNEEFVKRDDTYNLTCGGSGSWYAMNSYELLRKEKNKKAALKTNAVVWKDEDFRERASKRASALWKRLHAEGKIKPCDWTGKKHRAESKKKIGEANSVHQAGEGNSNHGNVWVYNVDLKKSIRIPKEELQNYLDTGWTKGRKMSWKN